MSGGTFYCVGVGPGDPELSGAVRARGLPAMAVKNCTMAGETLYADLSQNAPGEDAGYFVTVIVKERR